MSLCVCLFLKALPHYMKASMRACSGGIASQCVICSWCMQCVICSWYMQNLLFIKLLAATCSVHICAGLRISTAWLLIAHSIHLIVSCFYPDCHAPADNPVGDLSGTSLMQCLARYPGNLTHIDMTRTNVGQQVRKGQGHTHRGATVRHSFSKPALHL